MRIAILSTDDFDATTVDGASVRVGPESAGVKHRTGHLVDVTDDGRLDWLGHFSVQLLGVTADTTELILEAVKIDGEAVAGSDQVVVRPAQPRKASLRLDATSRITTRGDLRR